MKTAEEFRRSVYAKKRQQEQAIRLRRRRIDAAVGVCSAVLCIGLGFGVVLPMTQSGEPNVVTSKAYFAFASDDVNTKTEEGGTSQPESAFWESEAMPTEAPAAENSEAQTGFEHGIFSAAGIDGRKDATDAEPSSWASANPVQVNADTVQVELHNRSGLFKAEVTAAYWDLPQGTAPADPPEAVTLKANGTAVVAFPRVKTNAPSPHRLVIELYWENGETGTLTVLIS